MGQLPVLARLGTSGLSSVRHLWLVDLGWPPVEWLVSAPGSLSFSSRLSCAYLLAWNVPRKQMDLQELLRPRHFCSTLLATVDQGPSPESEGRERILFLDVLSFQL